MKLNEKENYTQNIREICDILEHQIHIACLLMEGYNKKDQINFIRDIISNFTANFIRHNSKNDKESYVENIELIFKDILNVSKFIIQRDFPEDKKIKKEVH